jgi:DNA-binding IclR family transcriptional regulator
MNCQLSSETRVKSLKKRNAGEPGVLPKVFKILDAIRENPGGLSLKAISESTRLNKATALRLLVELEESGYLFRDGDRRYAAGLKLTQFSRLDNFHSRLRDAARPELEGLCKETHETVNLAILHEGSVSYIDVIQSPHVFRLASRVAMRRPVYCTALGKALVAFTPQERREELLGSLTFTPHTAHTITDLVSFRRELELVVRRGYAVDQQESVAGARCVAAPILHPEGRAVAAVSVSGPMTRMSSDKVKLFAAAAIEAARAISARIYGKSA